MKRILALVLATLNGLNGLIMLFDGPGWYARVPGVTDTGPFNPHFVQDIGAAFLIASLALGIGAWRTRYWPAAVAGAGFIAAHGLIHLVGVLIGHSHMPIFDLVAVVIPSALALYAAIPKEIAMRQFLARTMLRAFRKRYDYDTSYLDYMLDKAPDAFFKFARINKIARYRQVVPPEAYFAAKLVGALAEDCGPCTQLVVDMALEKKVPGDQIEAILNRKSAAMNDDTVLAFRFADAVVRRSGAEDEAREAVRALWGDRGVIELTLALQIGRMFPMLKAGLGFARECRRVTVGQNNVDVVKQAA